MKIHNKEAWEWKEEDLEILIANCTEESVELEYKDSRALADMKKIKISKEVSAMANAAGGTIIYGIQTYPDREKKHIPKGFDKGIDPSIIPIEWLEQVIYSNIQPRIENLRVHSVKLEKNKPDRYVYVVHVDRALRAHQAADKRYYQRIDRTTTVLEDYQIQDINSRTQHPILEPKFLLSRITQEWPSEWDLIVELRNKGFVRARDWLLEFTCLACFRDLWKFDVAIQQTLSNNERSVTVGIKRTGAYQVIFPQYRERVLSLRSKPLESREISLVREQELICWRAFADDAPPRYGETKLEEAPFR